MKRFRRVSALAALIYLALSMLLAVPYFNWHYLQGSGFQQWRLLGAMRATARGFIWPYYWYRYSGRFHDWRSGFSVSFPPGWKLMKSQANPSALEPLHYAQLAAATSSDMKGVCFVSVGNLGDTFARIERAKLGMNVSQRIEKMIQNNASFALEKVAEDLALDRSGFILNLERAVFTKSGVHCDATATGEKNGLRITLRTRAFLVTGSRYSIAATGISTASQGDNTTEINRQIEGFISSLVID